ncbi:MAG: universal stress protein [Candidatus Sericytochromatia bacterium]|nr:universal stress protein [Candidatus Sericytochromatia bacterium]
MKVLVTTDGSRWSHAAIAKAVALLALERAEVHVLSVANLLPLLAAPEAPLAGAGPAIAQETESAVRDGARAKELLASLGVRATVHERTGNPTHEILDLARSLGVDVIVMGAHAHSGLERLLLGSTSDAVLHRWAGACLLLRPAPGDLERL